LKEGRRRAAAPRTRRDLRRETAQPERLKDLLRDEDLFGAVAVRLWRERYANGVADALGEQDRQTRGAGDDSLHPHPRLGEAEVQRIVAPRGEASIYLDEILNARDFGGDDDLVVSEPDVFGHIGGAERAG